MLVCLFFSIFSLVENVCGVRGVGGVDGVWSWWAFGDGMACGSGWYVMAVVAALRVKERVSQ